jgi:hypothetical protein
VKERKCSSIFKFHSENEHKHKQKADACQTYLEEWEEGEGIKQAKLLINELSYKRSALKKKL